MRECLISPNLTVIICNIRKKKKAYGTSLCYVTIRKGYSYRLLQNIPCLQLCTYRRPPASLGDHGPVDYRGTAPPSCTTFHPVSEYYRKITSIYFAGHGLSWSVICMRVTSARDRHQILIDKELTSISVVGNPCQSSRLS